MGGWAEPPSSRSIKPNELERWKEEEERGEESEDRERKVEEEIPSRRPE